MMSITMISLNGIAGEMVAIFEAKNRAREEAFQLCRAAIRNSSSSIRFVHRGLFGEAEESLKEAKDNLARVRIMLKDYQDIRYSGLLDNAEQEYSEAKCVYSIIRERQIFAAKDLDVEHVNYLSGLGDATGELRRHILDLIRKGKPEEGEYYLEIMEEIFYILMLFDYPEAIARGLRRKSDLARSMIERTRGDLTSAIEISKVNSSISRLEDKLKESGFAV